jgi:3D (Asp-Asp-Asp) domain-containing protein
MPWQSVGISQEELNRPGGLRKNDKVKIDGYSQIFTVRDTGSFTEDIPGQRHLDVFIGPTTHAVALGWGTKYRKVWRVGE